MLKEYSKSIVNNKLYQKRKLETNVKGVIC